MFLDEDRIEQKVRMKDKDKYKSILLWLIVRIFGSILDCIKSTKTSSGKYNPKITCYDWEAEY